ncbi:MAG: hypothetical protein ACI9R3_003910 [Verrucomicrobiales bacterium]|jgi:uncharacterized protein (TIGR00730 family)
MMANRKKRPTIEETDFTAGSVSHLSRIKSTTGNEDLDQRIAQLVAESGCPRRNDLIEEMVITALGIGTDDLGSGDLKLMNRSLREMREANKVFHPYRQTRKISIFGSARTAPEKPEYQAAETFGRRIAEAGFMTITGAGEGIMGAAQKGGGRDNGFGLNIRLPFEQGANETIEGDSKLVTFNYFFTRKLSFVKESEAIALFPGGFGTMDEGFEVLTLIQTGKARIIPIVMVDAPGGSYWKTWLQFVREHLLRLGMISESDFSLFKVFDDVDAAVEEVLTFYKVFHSYRYVGEKFVIRLNDSLIDSALETLNADFQDVIRSGEMVMSRALKAERNEPELAELPRLVFAAHQRNYGRLRELIDAINGSETVPTTEFE